MAQSVSCPWSAEAAPVPFDVAANEERCTCPPYRIAVGSEEVSRQFINFGLHGAECQKTYSTREVRSNSQSM